MNPLSLLFRAVDVAARRLLALRSLPWRRYAGTVLARTSDPWWWRRTGLRGAAWTRRSWRNPARRGIGMAALAAVAVGAATATASLTTPESPSHAAGYQADRAALTQQDRVPDAGAAKSGTPTTPTAPAKPKTPAAPRTPARPKKAGPPPAWQLPVTAKHYWVSSTFGTRWGVLHAGVDLAVPMRTPIHAAHSGRVSIAGAYDGYGNAVGIENGGGVATVYGHASRVVVHTGQYVHAGQLIAFSGNSGDSTGPHLHFEMRRYGVPFDPLPYLKRHGVDVVRDGGKG